LTIPEDIQRAGWRDLPAVYRLEKVCFSQDAWPLLDILAVLSVPGVVRLKAVSSGTVAGFIAGDWMKSRTLGRIITLGVLPGFRRQGMARRLLFAAESALCTPRYQLVLRRSNEGALRLYQEAGYRTTDSWPAYYRDGEEGLVMEKQATPVPADLR